jgi:hypothetical protein
LQTITVEGSNTVYSSLEGVLMNKSQTTLIQYPLGRTGAYTIPDNITSINYNAFYGCFSLTGILISESVTSIGASAFRDCTSLTNIFIPASVNSIGGAVFEGCSHLQTIDVDALNSTYSSSDGILFNKGQTELIRYPQTKIGSYNIPSSVIAIGSSAFHNCSYLTHVNIGASVSIFGEGVPFVFSGCTSLQEISVDALNSDYSSVGGVLLNNDQTELIFYPHAKTGSYIIPGNVTSIGIRSFENCTGLTNVIIPNSVSTIRPAAFRHCDGMNSVTIGNGVTTIGDLAFNYCENLTEIVIPDSVIVIGAEAFYGCTGLNSVNIGNGVTNIYSNAFSYCSSLTCVTIGNSVAAIESGVFSDCSILSSVYFKGDAPGLGTDVFLGVPATVYYLLGTTGWGSDFGGLPTAVWPLSVADVDADGDVNLVDFVMFAGAWQTVEGVDAEYNSLYDFSEPFGVIDAADLSVFVENWLITPCQ